MRQVIVSLTMDISTISGDLVSNIFYVFRQNMFGSDNSSTEIACWGAQVGACITVGGFQFSIDISLWFSVVFVVYIIG